MEPFPASAILIGLANIAIWVVLLLFFGALVMWALNAIFGVSIPANVQKLYLLLIGLVAVGMLIALFLGLPFHRFVSADGWHLIGYA